jgi:hypothetical protein
VTRFFSVLLGSGTVLTVYALGRVLWPEQPALALLASCFVAFNPMFLFISGSVNNDNLITLLASLTLAWLVWLRVGYPFQNEPPLWHFVGLGLLVGLAALTKVSGLGLLGLVGLTLLWMGARRHSWRTAILGNALVGLSVSASAGWWYWRNFRLYGDWTGTQNMVTMMGARPVIPTTGQLIAEIPGLLRSFWGLFGYFSVPMPTAVYWGLNVLLAAGLSGLLISLVSARQQAIPPRLRQTWPILVLWLVIMAAGFIRWTLRTPATQGRLLFPALAALAVLWAAGWLALPSRFHLLPALLMLPVAIWVPWGVIAPAYARPAPLDALPSSARPLHLTFGQAVELLAFEQTVTTVAPAESASLTLYWRSSKSIAEDYTVFVHLLDENDLVVAQRNLFHGSGAYPSSQWKPGTQFSDTYVLRLPRTAFAPAEARFEVGLYDHRTGLRLPASSGSDNVRFGQLKIQPLPGQFPNPQELKFEDNISLVGFTMDRRRVIAGEDMLLTLYWQSQRVPSRDYKVFVHLVGEGNIRAAQHDSAPQNGAAPTSHWAPGQVVLDEHPLTIAADAPAGAYQVVVGLYEGDTGRRLRLLRNGHTAIQADAVTLSGIRVITASK